jgi:hypothetical protein
MSRKISKSTKNLDTGQNSTSEQTLGLGSPVSSQASLPNTGKRLTVVLTDEAERMLTYLAQTQGITKSEALRKAIATEAYFLEERMRGSRVVIQKNNDEIREVIFR